MTDPPAGSAWARGERYFAAVIAASALATALFVVDQRLDLSVGALEVSIWWWLRIALFYSMLALGAGLLFRLAQPRLAGKLLFKVAPLMGVTLVLLVNHGLLDVLRQVQPPLRTLLVLVAAMSGLSLALATTRGRALRPLRGILAIAAPLTLFAALRPDARPSVPVPPDREIARIASNDHGRLLVIGLDGADWTLIDRLIARGLLPNLEKLRDRSVWGALETLRPTLSPMIWTTAVTGRTPEQHGIFRLQVVRGKGLDIGSQGQQLRVRGLGLRTLKRSLTRAGQLVRGPVTASERRVPAFWSIASFFSKPISVVSWWATWPAEPILGRIVSDRVFYNRAWGKATAEAADPWLTFPEELAPRMQRLAVHPDDIDYDFASRFLDLDRSEFEAFRSLKYSHHDVRSELRLYLSMFESDRRFARELIRQDLEQGRAPGDMLVLFRIIDLASHCCLKYSTLVDDPLDSGDADRRRFGRVTEEAYRIADEIVGELLSSFGAGNIVLLSDHGFRLEARPEGRSRYAHTGSPPGIFLGSGPAFTKGRVEGLTIFDIMPLLLYLKGIPVAENLHSRLRLDLLDSGFLAQHPAESIPSLDFVPIPRLVSRGSRADSQILEELRALGYLR